MPERSEKAPPPTISLRKEVITMDENKWEYDYSSSNNPAGDTGYPNVGSSGMNTANTASTFSESTQPSGGATPPPAEHSPCRAEEA